MMEVGDATIHLTDLSTNEKSKNFNSNNDILSDKDVKLSFSGLLRADEVASNQADGSPVEDDIVKSSPKEGLSEKETKEKQEWLEQIVQEQSEWDALELAHQSVSGGVKITPLQSFADALEYLLSRDMDKSDIAPTVERTGFRALLHFLFGPPKLKQSLVDERDSVFCIAKAQLQNGDELHAGILQTIYKKLTGSKFDCPRFGSHWQDVGFQGNDPATDLRGVGLLGLMHILYAVNNDNTYSFLMDFYRLSLDAEQNYPFCVMSFNVSRITLEVLREEKLNRDMNKANQVVAVMNKFYLAVFYHIHNIWKTQRKTIKDSGTVMKGKSDYSHLSTGGRSRQSSSSSEESQEHAGDNDGPSAEDMVQFTNITMAVKDEPVTDL